MKPLNYLKIAFVLVAAMTLAACGDDYYTDDYLKNSDEKLCRKYWVDQYVTADDKLCTHTIYFDLSGGGSDTKKFQNREGTGWSSQYSQESQTITWMWADKHMETLYITLAKDGMVTFENVWVREQYLSGKLGGNIVSFKISK